MEGAGSSAMHARRSRPSAASRHSPRSAQGRYVGQDGELHDAGSTCPSECEEEEAHRGDEGVVSRDEAEAPRRHLFRKKGKIYMLTNTVTGKSYVGQTIQRPSARIRQHASGKQFGHTRSCQPTMLQQSIAKHGWDAFMWEILESNIAHVPEEILDDRERYWIACKQTQSPKGYNMDEGGQGGKRYTAEMRAARSKAMQPWARSEKSRARKREVWQDAAWRAERCADRKVTQNRVENVQSRREKWDAKRAARLKATKDPQERRKLMHQARNQAKQGVKAALARGVKGRDLWGEFYARWGSDEAWKEWLKSGSCDAPRGCPL